jgi:hypothetical protein
MQRFSTAMRCDNRHDTELRRKPVQADDESDYKVGPGGPPLHTRFRKGQSGNPGGRSRKSLALLRDALNEPAVVTIDYLRVAAASSPTGAPMRSARPASTCWSRSTPARSA